MIFKQVNKNKYKHIKMRIQLKFKFLMIINISFIYVQYLTSYLYKFEINKHVNKYLKDKLLKKE